MAFGLRVKGSSVAIKNGRIMGKKKEIKKLVDKAHNIFNKTSVFEVVDKDYESAREFLNEEYDNPRSELIDRYLKVVGELRKIVC